MWEQYISPYFLSFLPHMRGKYFNISIFKIAFQNAQNYLMNFLTKKKSERNAIENCHRESSASRTDFFCIFMIAACL